MTNSTAICLPIVSVTLWMTAHLMDYATHAKSPILVPSDDSIA